MSADFPIQHDPAQRTALGVTSLRAGSQPSTACNNTICACICFADDGEE